MTEKQKRPVLTYTIIIGVILAAYFINVEVQTYFGKRALSSIGLEPRSLREATELAKKEDKLILADLSAIWCPTCRNLDNSIFSDPMVTSAIQAKYVFARIEYESPEGELFMKQYGIRSFPHILALDTNGKAIKKLPITTDSQLFIRHL